MTQRSKLLGARAALFASERLYRSIVDQVQDGVWLLDGDMRITFANPKVCEMVEVSAEEMNGVTFPSFLDDDGDSTLLIADGAAGRELRLGVFEVTLKGRRGRPLFAELHIQRMPMFGSEESGSCTIVVVRDIGERKAIEEVYRLTLDRERAAVEQMRAVDAMKNTFLNAVSHELRTPLTVIRGIALLLEHRDEALDGSVRREMMGRLVARTHQLERLLTDLLDVQRFSREDIAPTLVPADVGDLVLEVIDQSDDLAGCRVRADVASVVVPVDAIKLERIVVNLLANARKHAGPDPSIWVSVRKCLGGVVIAVEDDGDGVEPELRERIFTPFERGPSVPTHAPGVGIGLSLVAQFAKLHGGRAWVEDRVGGGASFRVYLPDENGPFYAS